MKKKLLVLIILVLFIILFYFFEFKKDEISYANDLIKLNNSNNQIITWGYDLVGSDNRAGRKIKIAILDSGINDKHEDLSGKVLKKFNAINPQADVIDDFGHGTAVAGIISANDNDVGIIGTTQNVELYDVKVLNEQGKSDIETVVKGINWSIDQKVDIINISFGFEKDYIELKQVIDKAIQNNIIIIAASGNTLGLRVDYPAKYDEVISVSALKLDLTRYSYSGKGKIDYSAPGKDILSTDNKGNYSEFSGTSFATAFVTGSIANLIGQVEEQVILSDIHLFLDSSVKDLGPKGFDDEYGYGLIQVN